MALRNWEKALPPFLCILVWDVCCMKHIDEMFFPSAHNSPRSLRKMFPKLAYIALRTPPMPNRVLKLAENYT